MAREHRERHKAHLDQHVRDASGEYHYIGNWYVVSGGRRALAPMCIRGVFSAAAAIGAGCVDFPGLRNTFYVILPYLFTVIALFGLGFHCARLVSGGGRLKTYLFEKSQDQIRPAAWAMAVCAVLTAVCGAVYLMKTGQPLDFGGVCFFALMGLSAALAYLTQRAYQKQKWTLEA